MVSATYPSLTVTMMLHYGIPVALCMLFFVHISHIRIPHNRVVPPLSRPLPAFRFESASHQILSDPNTTVSHSLRSFHQLVVKDYLQWHARKRAAYQAAIRRASSPRSTNAPRPPRMLVLRSDLSLTHGLGDRFRAIITAYLLAVLSNRLLLIDWRKPIPLSTAFASPPGVNFTYDDFLAPSHPYDDSAIIQGNYYHISDSVHVNVTTLFLDSVPRPNITRWFVPPPSRKSANKLLQRLSLLHPLPPCRAIPILFRALFTPTPALRIALNRRLHTPPIATLDAEYMPYVAIHARLGYGLGEIKKDASRFDLARSGTTLHGMAKCFANSAMQLSNEIHKGYKSKRHWYRPHFFLATDTPSFRPLVAQELGNKMPSSVLTYVDADVKHVRELQVSAHDDIGMFMDMFVDVFLLSWSNALLNLRSGFSDLAVWMGGVCNQRVVTYKECAQK